MIAGVKTKIRGLVQDLEKTSFEIFVYRTSKIFTLSTDNISSVLSVLKNGVILSGSDYSFNTDTKTITIIATLASTDVIQVNFKHYKYSDFELTEYIRSALVWISIFSSCENDFELDDEIYPTPENKEEDLIAIITSILIKPDYVQYDLPLMKVRYPNKLTKEEKIERLINNFNAGSSITDVINWEEE